MSTRGTTGDSWALGPLLAAIERAESIEDSAGQRWVISPRPTRTAGDIVAAADGQWSTIKLCRAIEGDGLILVDLDPGREAELSRLLLGEPHGES